jgi:hypothetical protein
MLIDYLNGFASARILGIAAKTKNYGNTFVGIFRYGLVSIFGCL